MGGRVIPFQTDDAARRLAQFLRETGLTPDEVRQIKWTETDWGRNVIYIGEREVRVSGRALQLMVDQLDADGRLW